MSPNHPTTLIGFVGWFPISEGIRSRLSLFLTSRKAGNRRTHPTSCRFEKFVRLVIAFYIQALYALIGWSDD